MAHQSDLISQDIEAYLQAHQNKSLLRFITCGSVDDGKSSLIGRLLFESQMLFEDQLAALESDSRKVGTRGEELDYALLLDGLAAEREQGITIDVAYRFFSTDRRKFIVADTPGHEQYTRNMVTGASTADLAIILIDARKGVLTQTRRHSTLVSLLGIRHVVLAINKMDLVDYSEQRFRAIEAEYRTFAAQIGLHDFVAIPLSAVKGDNVIEPQGNTPWYTGPSLMPYLETVELDETRAQAGDFRLPVQWVNRPNLDFRGFTGTIAGGQITPGARVMVLPSGRTSTVTRIVTHDGDLPRAVAQQAVTLTLADEIDISRGDLLCLADTPAQVASRFVTTLVWMTDQPLVPGRGYFMKLGARSVTAQVTHIRYRLDIDRHEQLPADQLALNEIAVCDLETDRPVAFDPYAENRDTGGFILIDRITNSTVAAGMLQSGEQLLAAEYGPLTARQRATALGQIPAVLWLPAGATAGAAEALATSLEHRLAVAGVRTMRLTETALSHGLNAGLGTSPADRIEAARRMVQAAALLSQAGLVTLLVTGVDTAVTATALVADLPGQHVVQGEAFDPARVAAEANRLIDVYQSLKH